MKRLPFVIVMVIAVLVAVVTGCGGTPRYDGRLTAADSLMRPNPDSALALLEALPAGALATAGDSAYRDLLLTQARYRCYVTATSDSTINRALAYYRAHGGEREKLTRAYLYKGAVMEELGHPDSAMLYYKHAEATAAPDDYFNLGYANMRMGALYRDNFAIDGKDIEKYEEALKFFRIIGDNYYQLRCAINLGALYRLKLPDRSISRLMEAKNLALQLKDTINYRNSLHGLAMTYYSQKEYDKAYLLVKEILNLRLTDNGFEFYANAADVYAKLGKPDSAEYLLNISQEYDSTNVIHEIMYLECIGEIALARGDTTTYLSKDNESKQKEDSVYKFESSIKIIQAETLQNKQAQEQGAWRYQKTKGWLLCISVIFLLAFFFLCYRYYYRVHKYDRLIEDLRAESDSYINELEEHKNKLKKLDIRDFQLKNYFDSQLWLVREIMEECYHTPNQKLVKKINQIIEFNDQNKDLWNKLHGYIDLRYNNIMEETRRNYPQLNDKDLLLLALSILDFSCIQIAMIMGYANPSSIGVIKQRLARKMEIEGNLRDYIDRFCQ
ncbi:MAG: hypothetical protein IKW85_07995 [Muribaculaceae bacterium]|nr:hypothetical protein [Muribaculaceae bacterium]